MHFTIQIFDKSGCERDDFPDTEQQNFTLAESTKRTGGRLTKYTVTGSKPFNSCKENSVKQIASCESDHLKEVKEDEEDADAESAEPFPHFTSKLISTAYRVVNKPTSYIAFIFLLGHRFCD
ncbi:hypothetical protein M0R45_001808 [Rubus argutus]|uniref:Uncharacterized protein n=1 Tax=Rubus argutus TaxID=59490 RepID=A0AAW1VFT2_RUBAR